MNNYSKNEKATNAKQEGETGISSSATGQTDQTRTS